MKAAISRGAVMSSSASITGSTFLVSRISGYRRPSMEQHSQRARHARTAHVQVPLARPRQNAAPAM